MYVVNLLLRHNKGFDNLLYLCKYLSNYINPDHDRHIGNAAAQHPNTKCSTRHTCQRIIAY